MACETLQGMGWLLESKPYDDEWPVRRKLTVLQMRFTWESNCSSVSNKDAETSASLWWLL